MKMTSYFSNSVLPRRTYLTINMCKSVVEKPYKTETQEDGRIRVWGAVGDKWLRVVLLEDGETLHNAFFDRRFKP